MDPQDGQQPDPVERPWLLEHVGRDPDREPASAASRPSAAWASLRRSLVAFDEVHRSTSFVPPSETVVIDVRRSAFLLVPPALRTLAGAVVLLTGPLLVPLLALLAATAWWASARLSPGLRRTASTAALVTAGTVVADVLLGTPLCLLLLLGWLADDVADWWSDRLVVSDKRIYRRHGVLTRHSPSISLTAIAYLDAAVSPVGRLFRFGTLRLDSVAQRDAPLSRFDLVPDVVAVSHEILRLRSAAMPKLPPMPY